MMDRPPAVRVRSHEGAAEAEARVRVEAARARRVAREAPLGTEREEHCVTHGHLPAHHLAGVAVLVERRARRAAPVRLLHVLRPHRGRLGHVTVSVDHGEACVGHRYLGDFDFAAALLAGFTSIEVAVIRYSTVTLAPTLSSPVTFVEASRAISHRSLPFWTAIMSFVTSSTGPVTWYVLAIAA